MNLTSLKTWLGKIVSGTGKPVRRAIRRRGNWGCETELMEQRALLSAVGVSTYGGGDEESPVAVEVADSRHPRASVAYPNVAGQWTISGNGLAGTASLTQTKAKVTANINISGFAVQVKGKFKKSAPHTLIGSSKVTNPMGGGKVKVNATIEFGDVPEPTTFTGSVSAAGLDIPVSGTKV